MDSLHYKAPDYTETRGILLDIEKSNTQTRALTL
jgi:hypothetical protein